MRLNKLIPYMLSGFLMLNPVKTTASENNKEPRYKAYVTFNQSNLNPKKYNNEINKISFGKAYGSSMGFGAGLEKRINDKFSIDIQSSKNSQRVDSIAEDLSGQRFSYGYNQLGLIYSDIILKYKLPVTRNKKFGTSLELGAGLASTLIQIETSNGDETSSGSAFTIGGKISASIEQKLPKDFYIRGSISSRKTFEVGGFDASCIVNSIDLGVKFK